MGYKEGQGLVKQEEGNTTPVMDKKTDKRDNRNFHWVVSSETMTRVFVEADEFQIAGWRHYTAVLPLYGRVSSYY